MGGTHSLLSPSSAHRWSRCAGSVFLSRDVKDTANPHSARGTVMHSMAEVCLNGGRDAREVFTGSLPWNQDGFQIEVDDDMLDQVQSYVDGVRRCSPGERYIEVRLDSSDVLGVRDQGGTADAVILNTATDTLEVHDAKFGHGRVMAQDNRQGLIYMAAGLMQFQFSHGWRFVKFVIHQPAIDHYDEWLLPVEKVWHLIDTEIKPAAKQVVKIKSVEQALMHLHAGDEQCKWCPVRGDCRARRARVASVFEDLSGETQDTGRLSDEELDKAMQRLDEIEGWCKAVRGEALRRALQGHALPSFKVVRGRRGARGWTNRKEVEDVLGLLLAPEDMYEPAPLITPSVAEKRLKADYKAVAGFVTQSEGGLSLAPITDPRSAVDVGGVTFEVIDDEPNGEWHGRE